MFRIALLERHSFARIKVRYVDNLPSKEIMEKIVCAHPDCFIEISFEDIEIPELPF